jgi:hypothetical protein
MVRFKKTLSKSLLEPHHAGQIVNSGNLLALRLVFPRQVRHTSRDQLGPVRHGIHLWLGSQYLEGILGKWRHGALA